MRRSKIRLTVAMAIALVVLLASTAMAAITWANAPGAASSRVGQDLTWNNGDPSIANNGDGSMSAVYVTDTINGVFAQDTGPYMGVYYLRSSNDGGTWSKAFRLNGKYHADRVTTATCGNNVVTAFMSQTKYYTSKSTFDPAAARYIYTRTNTSNGTPANWNAAAKVPGQTTTSRGDYLYIASNGTNVYLVTTNTHSGAISLWKSTNCGVSFTGPTTVGTTTATDTGPGTYVGGPSGLPAVAASGNNVGVIYTSTSAGQVTVKISTNNGTSFGSPTIVAASGGLANNGYEQAASGPAGTMAFTWTTATGAFIAVSNGSGVLGSTHTIQSFPDTTTPGIGANNAGGDGAIVAFDPGTSGKIGVTLTECKQTIKAICNTLNYSDGQTRESLVYYQSTNSGTSWSTGSIIAMPTKSSGTYLNEFGSLVFHGGKPYAYWNAHNNLYSAYTNQLKVGTGTP